MRAGLFVSMMTMAVECSTMKNWRTVVKIMDWICRKRSLMTYLHALTRTTVAPSASTSFFLHSGFVSVTSTLLCKSKKSPPEIFWHFFPKRLGIFTPYFTFLLYVPIYAGLQIFIQLSATLTKLCHIKRDHHNVHKMSTIDRNACWVVALNYGITSSVGDNWIKICIRA